MLTILFVHGEGLPHDERCTTGAKGQAYVSVYASHVKYHYKDKYAKQPTCKNEQVLRFQTFELNGPSNAFIDVVITHG